MQNIQATYLNRNTAKTIYKTLIFFFLIFKKNPGLEFQIQQYFSTKGGTGNKRLEELSNAKRKQLVEHFPVNEVTWQQHGNIIGYEKNVAESTNVKMGRGSLL